MKDQMKMMTDFIQLQAVTFGASGSSREMDLGSRSPSLVGRVFKLDERHFRRVGRFNSRQDSWIEWRTHFPTAVRESSPAIKSVNDEIFSAVVRGEAMLATPLEEH